jgi:hypothetical protein
MGRQARMEGGDWRAQHETSGPTTAEILATGLVRLGFDPPQGFGEMTPLRDTSLIFENFHH